MAKSILIEFIETKQSSDGKYSYKSDDTNLMSFPLTDDVNLEVMSDFASMTESIPLIGQITSFMTMMSGLGGFASEGTLDFQNLSNVQRWQRTHPIKINLNLLLYTETNAKKEVYDKMMELISLTVPTQDPNNPKRYRVPGISLSSIKQTTKKGQKVTSVSQAKLIAVRIPGIIYLPIAMVTKAIPTISKEETDSGYPLWATLNVEITGLYPATGDLLKQEDTSFGFLDSISNREDLTTNEEARKLAKRYQIYNSTYK